MKINQRVLHPKREEWGPGHIVSLSGTRATIDFSNVGIKTIDLAVASLDCLDDVETVPHRPRHVDMETLRRLCQQFHSEMEHNRRGFNDGRMAVKVLEEMERDGRIRKSTETQLLNWCYTDGSVFQAGKDLARQICICVYGRLLPDPDASKRHSR